MNDDFSKADTFKWRDSPPPINVSNTNFDNMNLWNLPSSVVNSKIRMNACQWRFGPHFYLFTVIIQASYDNFLCIHTKITDSIAVKPKVLSNKICVLLLFLVLVTYIIL